MAAAAAGDDYRISFGGRTQLQFAPDTARVFIASARAARRDARVFHLGGPAVTLAEVASAIEDAAPGVTISVDEDTRLPFPDEFDGSALDEALGGISWTPLEAGVRATVERLRSAQV
jgi:nucleoside-diphosphate-sugar epimerase